MSISVQQIVPTERVNTASETGMVVQLFVNINPLRYYAALFSKKAIAANNSEGIIFHLNHGLFALIEFHACRQLTGKSPIILSKLFRDHGRHF